MSAYWWTGVPSVSSNHEEAVGVEHPTSSARRCEEAHDADGVRAASELVHAERVIGRVAPGGDEPVPGKVDAKPADEQVQADIVRGDDAALAAPEHERGTRRPIMSAVRNFIVSIEIIVLPEDEGA